MPSKNNRLSAAEEHRRKKIYSASPASECDDLLYSYVCMIAKAIDSRTPCNANHSRNMVLICEKFLSYETDTNGPYKASRRTRREIMLSIWLHDIGKMVTPLSIMNKSTKLGDTCTFLDLRYGQMRLTVKLKLAEGQISQKEYEDSIQRIGRASELVHAVNGSYETTDAQLKELSELTSQYLLDDQGGILRFLTDSEYEMLSVKHGTLTASERTIMENHASATDLMLSEVHFPPEFSHVRSWASSHHEYLDGSGYPKHLSAESLSWEARLITILDIFEALISTDRPYRLPVTVDRAIETLFQMAYAGKLDINICEEFKKSSAWTVLPGNTEICC